MKKKLLVLLLVLCAVICVSAFAASAEETTEHKHCVCGGAPTGAAEHTCDELTWQPLPEGTTDLGTLAAGNYYLTSDVVTVDDTRITKDLNICLNGHHITTNDGRALSDPLKCTVSITDCSYDAASGTWEGSITGGTSVYGGIMYTRSQAVVNIYGGNFYGNGTVNRMGGLFVIAQDSGASYDQVVDAATLNLYNGLISGGKSGEGGNIYVMHVGSFNMYGGTVTEGEAHYIKWTTTNSSGTTTTSTKVGRGGNIKGDSGAYIRIYGGTISNGTAVQSATTASNSGNGGNIWSNGYIYISGGQIYGGYAEHNTTTNSAHTAWSYSTPGRGGNIWANKVLEISGGDIYDGRANGIGGGNIWFETGTFTLSGGRIWGGIANADNDAAKSAGLLNAYEVCGGSIRIQSGSFTMTGGTVGIDAEGKPAGGYCMPTGTEGGNFYLNGSANKYYLKGGTIAYGNVIGQNEDGTLIYGTTNKGGNISGSAQVFYQDEIVVRDGYARSYGGNITLYNSSNTKIQGGTISGGKAGSYGGNISMSGSGTTNHVLEITGGTISGGTAPTGANIYVNETKQLDISNATISDGVASSNGGGIYGTAKTVVTAEKTTFSGGKATGGGGGALMSLGTVTLTDCTFVGGESGYAGAALRMNEATSNLTLTGCTFDGGHSGSYGGNLYVAGIAAVTDCTFKNGYAKTAGGNVATVEGSTVTLTGCTFENGTTDGTGGNAYNSDNDGDGVIFENCNFVGGTSVGYGGSMFASDSAKLTLTNCNMNGGKAANTTNKVTYGGNLYSTANEVTITGGTYENGAAQHAGNMYLGSGTYAVSGVTFKNGIANLCLDGGTNGNGGNIQTASNADVTLTGCTFEGGEAMRGGSIAAFGGLTLTDCSVGGATATFGGGTIFAYQKGYINLTGTTEVFGGECKESGGTIHINSFEATEPNVIGDGVKVHTGKAGGLGWGIMVHDGVLKLSGDTLVEDLWVTNTKDTCYVDATELAATTPVKLCTTYGAKFGVSETDTSAYFAHVNGYVTWADGELSVVEYGSIPYSASIGAGKSHTVALYNIGEMIMTVPDVADGTVTYNGTVYTPDENGTITITLPAGMRGTEYVFTFTNNGTESLKFAPTFTYPVGHMENPAQLVIGENTATVAEGNTSGYNYTYTAEKTGTLLITMPEGGWTYAINNLTTYVYGDAQWSDSDPVVNPAVVEVTEGDLLQIMVNTYDAANPWTAPAGTITFTARYADYVAQVGEQKYMTLAAAVEAAEAGATVTLLSDCSGAGVVINKDITIDFGGYTYTLTAPVGSTGTVSNGLQLLKGNTVTLTNGTLTVAEENKSQFYILVQNYANLTVADMTLDGTNLDKYSTTDGDSYTLSNNSGNVVITGATNITANDEGALAYAFDVCKYASYEAPVVTVDTTGTITGNIEVSEGLDENLQISNGTYTMDVTAWCVEGMAALENWDGTYYIGDAPGTEANPVMLSQQENTVENAGTTWYQGYFSGMILTVTGEEFTVTYNGETLTPVDGVVTTTVKSANPRMPVVFAITGEGTYTANFTYPIGNMENPAQLVIGENTASIEAGNTMGYFFTWTAEEMGELTITMPAGDWTYAINNMTTYQYGDTQWSDSDPVVNPATVTVAAGDQLQIMVNSYDPADMWSNPAAELIITASFRGPVAQVGEQKYMTLAAAVEAAEAGATVTLLSDCSGAGVVINKDITIDFGGYTYTLTAPVGSTGTVSNGLQLLKGNTVTLTNGTLTVAEENKSQFYILVQNYANLTVADMTLDGTNLDKYSTTDGDSYTLSNNSGNVVITGATNITANDEGALAYAFDVCKYASYEAPVVTVDTTGTITGNIEVSEGLDENLQISNGTYTMDVTAWCVEGMAALENWDGTYYIGDAPGTEANPVMLSQQENTVENAGTTWYQGYFSGMILTVTGEDFTVTYNGETLTPVDGVVTTTVKSANPRMPVVFAITGEGTYTANFTYPIGNMENPAELVIGENTASIEAGNTMGYFFTWTAPAAGELTITMPEGDWTYAINNMTTYVYGDTQWSDSDPVVNPATVTVAAGDQLQIMVNSYDPADMWSNPAAELIITAEFAYAAGTEQNPVFLANQENTVENAGTTWYQGYFSGMILTVTGEEFTVTYNGETLTPVDGVVTTTVKSANPRMPVVFAITGEGTYTANFTYPIGNMENPAELVIGENTASIEAGNTMGYFFTWTAPAAGELTITMPEGDWTYAINNMTTYQYGDTQWSDSDPVVNPATVTVAAGDQLQIMVNSYDPANMWENPAAELIITAEFAYAAGTEENPVFLSQQENTVENAGTTWYQGYFSGMILTVTGEDFTVTYNGETLTPVDGVVTTTVKSANPRMPVVFAITGEGTYTANFTYPIGNMENPAELVIGENTASIEAGNTMGYFFTWTAPAAGDLTITMPEGDWTYAINNMTTYVYGDTQWSDSDPVVNPATVTVAAGDQLQIMVNSYDPANMWENPAAELVITAAFEETVVEPETPMEGTGVAATTEAPILVEYTAESAGTLSVTISGTPGYKLEVYDANGETVGLPKSSSNGAEQTETYDVEPGTYTVRMIGYANWDEANGTINYSITFTASQGGTTEKAEYEVDYDNTLVVGDNTLTLLETATTTIYAFEPTEEGTYTFTAPEGAVVGYWGAGEWFLTDPASTSNTTEWTCTGVGQSAYIGVSGVEGEFVLTVEKTADGEQHEQTEYTVYENTHTFPEGFNNLTGEETLLSVNVSEAHTAVLGTDGYYHLDSADGPILYVDLQTDAFMLSNAYGGYGANTMRGEVNGMKYDFLTAMEAYSTYDLYPLTEDLMLFIKGYGAYQGWFMNGLSPFAEIDENTNADTAWMVLCRYAEAEEPEIEKFDIDVARMILGNALEFQFGVSTTKIPDKTGYYAVIEKSWADGTTTTETIPASQWGTAGQYWAIVYDGLAAKEMSDVFNVTVYNADGVAVSNAREDSVVAYVERAYAGQKATGKTMMVDMLNYGAAAQTHFDYGTDNLCNAGLTDAQKAVATATAPEMSNDQVKGTNYQGTRFLLTSAIQVQLGFKNLTTDMYAIYTYTNAAGEVKEVRVEGADFVDNNGTKIGVELSALVYADARALVEVTVYNADGTVYATASDSIESACARSTGDVFVELMKFADSAKAHLYG